MRHLGLPLNQGLRKGQRHTTPHESAEGHIDTDALFNAFTCCAGPVQVAAKHLLAASSAAAAAAHGNRRRDAQHLTKWHA